MLTERKRQNLNHLDDVDVVAKLAWFSDNLKVWTHFVHGLGFIAVQYGSRKMTGNEERESNGE